MSIAVCPLPVVPSNTNKLDIGVSRALSALRMSCAKTPPTTAQTGENSCPAVVESDLEKAAESRGSSQSHHDQIERVELTRSNLWTTPSVAFCSQFFRGSASPEWTRVPPPGPALMVVHLGVVPGTPIGLYYERREVDQIRDGADQDRSCNEAYTRIRRVNLRGNHVPSNVKIR